MSTNENYSYSQSGYKRRVSDLEATKLFEMLENENDASKRALLLVLSSLNANLMANTAATESIRKDLTAHLSSYKDHMEVTKEYINKGKGAWRVFAWVLGAVQLLMIGVVGNNNTDMKAFAASISSLQVASSSLEHRITSLEKKIP